MRRLRAQVGSIYIEALLAAAIITAALIPVITGLSYTAAAQDLVGRRTVAMGIARSQLERLHAKSNAEFDVIAAGPVAVTDPPGYTVALRVTSRSANRKDVWVDVDWTDAKGQPQRVTLATSVTRRP